jgi:hypothetical protein
MIDILVHLKPRRMRRGQILFKSLASVEEVLFIESGSLDIGFELNDKAKYCIRLSDGGVVGSYNCTFNKKTMFIYRCR